MILVFQRVCSESPRASPQCLSMSRECRTSRNMCCALSHMPWTDDTLQHVHNNAFAFGWVYQVVTRDFRHDPQAPWALQATDAVVEAALNAQRPFAASTSAASFKRLIQEASSGELWSLNDISNTVNSSRNNRNNSNDNNSKSDKNKNKDAAMPPRRSQRRHTTTLNHRNSFQDHTDHNQIHKHRHEYYHEHLTAAGNQKVTKPGDCVGTWQSFVGTCTCSNNEAMVGGLGSHPRGFENRTRA